MYTIPPNRQFTYFKEERKLAIQRKIEVKSDILIEDTSVLLEDESTQGLWVPEKNKPQHRDLDWEENSDSKDNLEMIDNDEDILDIDVLPN